MIDILIPVGVAGVAILVIFEFVKYAKAHPTSSVVQQVEAKIPASAASALGIAPVLTGDHVVAVVQATGAAVAQAVQAVASAKVATAPAPVAPPVQPASPAGGQSVVDLFYGKDVTAAPVAPVAAAAPMPAFTADLWIAGAGDWWITLTPQTPTASFTGTLPPGTYYVDTGGTLGSMNNEMTFKMAPDGQVITVNQQRFTVAAPTAFTMSATLNEDPKFGAAWKARTPPASMGAYALKKTA